MQMSFMLMAKLKRCIYAMPLLLMVFMSYYSHAIEVENQAATNNLKTLQISAGEWPPFLSESLPYKGVIAHLITDVFAQANIEVSFTFLPWPRAYHDTLNNKYAATAVWMFEKDRARHYLYSEAVLNERFVFFYQKQRQFSWYKLSDLKGLLLGGGLGYSYGKKFDKAIEEGLFEISRVSTTEQNFQRLVMGRIDAFAEEQNVGYHTLNTKLPELIDTISHHPKPVLVNQSFLLFPKNNPSSEKLLVIFNQELVKFKQTGRYQAYFDALESGAYKSLISVEVE
ncbi:transporter substrate-binding domain-containing protein [Pseudoalteromonas sp. S558]|uniref:substrate-binding periplasmic protein n=1 Tax=Pseudoalteromonas sp. S558 TaxID=2066515 RepID=UPI00207B9F8D|nr:transporter substrate-binding domain-containing protein [Pseudoalteromonas sp. S558]